MKIPQNKIKAKCQRLLDLDQGSKGTHLLDWAAMFATLNLRALAVATFATLLLIVGVYVGSRNLQNFDAALVPYLFGTLFAAFGIVYRYVVWLQRPPTRRYFQTQHSSCSSAASSFPTLGNSSNISSPTFPSSVLLRIEVRADSGATFSCRGGA